MDQSPHSSLTLTLRDRESEMGRERCRKIWIEREIGTRGRREKKRARE